MIIDTSAIIAIFFEESDAAYYADKIITAEYKYILAASYLEASMVLSKSALKRTDVLEEFLSDSGIATISFDKQQALIAKNAFEMYGKGIHKAGLNYGDCFAYALAKHKNMPLLFKGNDFNYTDIKIA